MFHAFTDMRSSKDEGMWIDQICIDQTDGEDKQHNINFMGAIYQSARLVVVVLEDVEIYDDEHDLVVQITELYGTHEPEKLSKVLPTFSYGDSQLQALCSIYVRILSARWFSRAWCAYEFVLGEKYIFLIPGKGKYFHRIYAEWLSSLFIAITEKLVREPNHILVEQLWGEYGQRSSDRFDRFFSTSRNMKRPWNQDSAPLKRMFTHIHGLHSFILTDKIKIGINVSGLGIYYKGKVETAKQCQWVLTLLSLAGGDPEILVASVTSKDSDGEQNMVRLTWPSAFPQAQSYITS
jgi:hypothetical protein